MRSLVMSAPCSSAITTPRCSTITREHSRSSSALSDEHTTVAVPSRRRQVDEAVDVGLRADVDALRRLVEHEHPWRAAEPAGHHDLLLVAARQLADDRLAARRAHVELVDPHLGVLLLGALAQPTAATRTDAGRRSSGSRAACSVRNSASLARSAGTAQSPASIAARGSNGRDRRAVDDDLADAQPAARQQAGQLVAAGAGQAGDADDLAAAHVEVDRRQLGAADAARRQHRPVVARRSASIRVWAAASATSSRPSIRLARLSWVSAARRLGGDPPTVAQDGHAIGDRQHLVEVVADEQHRGARRGDAAQRAEQAVHLGPGKRRGGLVEHEQREAAVLAGAVEGAGDADGRALRLGELGDRARRVDLVAEGVERGDGVAPVVAAAQRRRAPAAAGSCGSCRTPSSTRRGRGPGGRSAARPPRRPAPSRARTGRR